MASAPTYVPIQTTTLGSAASTVTLSSIPNTYTDLFLVIYISGVSTATGMGIQFNSDTGSSNYSMTQFGGDGSSSGSARQSNINYIRFAYSATFRTTNVGISRINIMNYSNTTTYKPILSRSDIATDGLEGTVGTWRSNSAINSLTILPTNGSYTISAGSTFTLYGILAA
jgi:hypothetical protein